MTDHELQVWTLGTTVVIAVGTLGAAVASALAAKIAAKAASTWRDGLKQQRADECVAAIENCAAAIGKSITLIEKSSPGYPGGNSLDVAWEMWAKVRSTMAVVSRYHDTSFEDMVSEGVKIMERLTKLSSSGKPQVSEGQKVNEDFGKFNAKAFKQLKEWR